MQKKLIPGIVAICMLAACSNELDLTAPWKDIPVIYGVLSPADTAHYVRIEKAFLDPNKSALEIARIPDSLYYSSLDAQLVNTGTGEKFTLEEVDATNEGYPRNDGVFATEPNILYKIAASQVGLQPGQRYRLEVRRSDQLPLVTAETNIVGRPSLIRPGPSDILKFPTISYYKVQWLAAAGAAFYDLIMYIHYDEYHISDPSNVESKTVAWKLAGVWTSTEFDVAGVEFYKFLSASIQTDPTVRRTFKGIDVQVRAGGSELYEFQRVQLANTGITSAGGDLPQYTNLSEGVGIFSSSNRAAVLGLDINLETRDSLIDGSFTKSLNFQ